MSVYRKHAAVFLVVLGGVIMAACTTPGIQPVPTIVTDQAIEDVPTEVPFGAVGSEPSQIQSVFNPKPVGTSVQATLIVQEGVVELRRSGETSFSRIGQTVLISTGDSIRTSATGTATLVFLQDTETILFPNTVLIVDSFVQRSDRSHAINLIQLVGQTFNRSNIDPARSEQITATPYGVASVRGTSYWIEVVIEGPLANTLLGQELEAFINSGGFNVNLGDFDALLFELMRLLAVTPGKLSVDVATGVVTIVDSNNDVVFVHPGITAETGTDNSGNTITVTVFVLDRFCGDNICDPYLNETVTTCRADCG